MNKRMLLIVLLIAYIVSPIDLIPDFWPGIGQIDDAGALIGLLWTLYRAYREHARVQQLKKENEDESTHSSTR